MKSVLGKFQTLRKNDGDPPRHRFLVVGLPRSGTTYLMTLLNAHRHVVCQGEQYNPHAVIGTRHDNSREAVFGRDSDPVAHLEGFFARPQAPGITHAGFKYMIGHNVQVLQHLEQMPGLSLIYIWRENRLAQVSSLIRAAGSRNWAQTRAKPGDDAKIAANPRQISHRWHEYATFDYLFQNWLEAQPHPCLTLEYREMFQSGFKERLCDFLGLEVDPNMKSPLVKQNANTIVERFENPEPLRLYFNKIGYGHWLDDEL